MRQGVTELISDRLDFMPAGERRAAQTLIASYPIVGLKTVAEFSQAAGVSSPTILRFVARLGFQNYPEFQAALQDELAAQLQSPATRAGRPQPSRRGQVPATVEATLENIRETFRHVSEKQITDIVDLLAGFSVAGGTSTGSHARMGAGSSGRHDRSEFVHRSGVARPE